MKQDDPILPQPVDDVDIAFPGSVNHLMPKWEDIPEEFRKASYSSSSRTKWNQLFSDWFFSGINSTDDLVAKDGIDKNLALRHIHCIMRSFQPKHQHKEATIAYLFSLWFKESSTWERRKKERDV